MRIEKAYRITVLVPVEALEALLASITRVLPALDERYREVFWWSAPGTEQFRPLSGAAPAAGEIGKLNRVASIKLQFVIPKNASLLKRVLEQGVYPAHPWEEPAITIDKCRITRHSSS